ncbi:MAG TPA: hypothetical protein VF348_07745 [Usitatibacter sp.]
MHLEIRGARVHAEGAQVDRLEARTIASEHVDLSVAQQVESPVRGGECAAGADGAEYALAGIDDQREARRESGERRKGYGVALNDGSASFP